MELDQQEWLQMQQQMQMSQQQEAYPVMQGSTSSSQQFPPNQDFVG